MNTIDAIKSAAAASGIPTTHIGPALGHSEAYIAGIATRGSTPRADTLAKILAPCGYSLAVVPAGKELPNNSFVIDPSPIGADAKRKGLEQQLARSKAETERLEQAISKLQTD